MGSKVVVDQDHDDKRALPSRQSGSGSEIEGLKRVQLETVKKVVIKDDPIARVLKKLVKDDPRRVVHSFKFGLALTLVSLLYSVRPLYDGVGVAGMWAVLTVVFVFEFTVGATINRVVYRSLATMLGGAVGVGAVYFANLFGGKAEPFVLTFLVFLIVAAASLLRFESRIKTRHDYGVLIFIVTMSLVSVSGHRVDEIFDLAVQRLSTILIGGAICGLVSAIVFPVWAGHELHTLVANHLDSLALFLQGFEGKTTTPNSTYHLLQTHKSILTSKTLDETLANFSTWEPYFHGRFTLFNHPRKKCLEIGSLARQCAYRLEALTSCYVNHNSSVKESLKSEEPQREIQNRFPKMALETSKVLRELASAMKTRQMPNQEAINNHIVKSKQAVKQVENLLIRSISSTTILSLLSAQGHLSSIISNAAVMSLLISVADYAQDISIAVHSLSELAHFKTKLMPVKRPTTPIKPDHDVIDVDDLCYYSRSTGRA